MAGIINSIATAWFDWQSSMLWQTAVLIGVVAGIDRLIRKRAWPQLRYMLWLLVFVKLVLPTAGSDDSPRPFGRRAIPR